MIHRVSGFIKAGFKDRRQIIVLAAAATLVAVAANAQSIGPPPGLTGQVTTAPVPPRQAIANPGAPNPVPSANPICVRLETQLAAVTQGSADPVRAEQIKRSEDAIAKQQADLDRTVEKAHRAGCAGQGFLALFSSFSPQCGPITSQIQQMRGNLDKLTSDLEQLKSGGSNQDSACRALIGQLAQNNCGAQYTTAANEAGPSGFFERLFSNGGPGGA